MDFARKHLEKYGWSKGKGLGKHEDGISEALKPKLKRSMTGVGHDAASDFTEHWWSDLYNKAAGNVEVEEVNGRTKSIRTKDSSEFEITNDVNSIKRKKKTKTGDQYAGTFVRKAVLTSGGAKTEKLQESEEEDELTETGDASQLTDEQLFAACGGRTAHKGARHGLRALGKLARIEMQEQALLQESRFKGYSQAKQTKGTELSVTDLQVVEDMSLNSDGDLATKKKSKRLKKKKCSEDHLNSNIENTVDIADRETESKKEKKKKRIAEDEICGDMTKKNNKNKVKEIENYIESNGGRKKKKK